MNATTAQLAAPAPFAFDYYVTKENGAFVLRQPRFAHLVHTRNGEGHPHDICAVASSLAELKDMVSTTLKGSVDYSKVEQPTPAAPSYNQTFAEHQQAALSTDLHTFHLSARFTSRKFIGGIVGLLNQLLTNENYEGKTPTLRELSDGGEPKFLKVNKARAHELIENAAKRGFFTTEQAAELKSKF